MKNFTQKLMSLLVLVCAITFTANAQSYEELQDQISDLQVQLQIAQDALLFEYDAGMTDGEMMGYDLGLADCETSGVYEEIDSYINLPQGWSMFGYTCLESVNVINAMYEIDSDIVIIKDELGSAYLPEWGFNAIGDFNYGEGYQIKLSNQVDNFQFCPMIVGQF